MHGPNVETAAKIIAENVVSAVEHGRHGNGGLKRAEHTAAIADLMRALLSVMPTDDSATLAAACNSVLADLSPRWGSLARESRRSPLTMDQLRCTGRRT